MENTNTIIRNILIIRCQLRAEIIDDGDKIKTKIKKNLEYDEAEAFMILLQIRYLEEDSHQEIEMFKNSIKLI